MNKLIYEDQLPKMSKGEYAQWFLESAVIDGVRMGPNPAYLKRKRVEGLLDALTTIQAMMDCPRAQKVATKALSDFFTA